MVEAPAASVAAAQPWTLVVPKGKKIRVFNNTMRDFLGGVGATAVSMAFAEVVSALSAGVVDIVVREQFVVVAGRPLDVVARGDHVERLAIDAIALCRQESPNSRWPTGSSSSRSRR